mmetsp:Transcript_81065/g.160661  ORF Transcript_81065/g.160661 Transcript_81065/m.160661 type:complete len:331 (+) Transcript_81065:40-1032(+)
MQKIMYGADSQLLVDMDYVTDALPDFIAVVATFSELSTIASASRSNRTWCEATRSDRLWREILHRQWILGEGALGPHFVDGWRDICRCFCTINPGVWRPSPNSEQQQRLACMSEFSRNFLFGIAHGFVPSEDGFFTYHCSGATPIHYRYEAAAESGAKDSQNRPIYMEHGATLCTGGSWEWSPDRTTWFPTNTFEITRGRFGTGRWHLVTDNRDIVFFLEHWPLVPLVARSIDLQRPAALMSHRVLNERSLTDFMHAMYHGVRTTPCVATDAFTVHFFFVPPLYLACRGHGWQLAKVMPARTNGGSVEEFHNVLAALNRVHDQPGHVYHL